MYFWTAGQRVDPTRESTFVWRVTSTDSGGSVPTVSTMSYTNWYSQQPDFAGSIEPCMHLFGGLSYSWNDASCKTEMCAVCELNMSV